MTDKLKIKVIKKDDLSATNRRTKVANKSKRAAAREAVSTVTNWVTDFQLRKRDETKSAIEKFLVQKPQPIES